jgi:hypothetical protein
MPKYSMQMCSTQASTSAHMYCEECSCAKKHMHALHAVRYSRHTPPLHTSEVLSELLVTLLMLTRQTYICHTAHHHG